MRNIVKVTLKVLKESEKDKKMRQNLKKEQLYDSFLKKWIKVSDTKLIQAIDCQNNNKLYSNLYIRFYIECISGIIII